MFPTLFQVTIPPAIPRLLLVLGLAAVLMAASLGLLLGAVRKAVGGLLAASVILAMLLAVRAGTGQARTVRITPFGASLCLSIILGGWLLLRATKPLGMPRTEVMTRICYTVLAGFIGARVGEYLLGHDGASTWYDLVSFRRGGFFGYGAYVGGLLAVHFTNRHNRAANAKWLDLVTPAVLLGIGLTRIGCYFQGCDFGRPLLPAARPMLAVLGTFPRWEPDDGDRILGSPAWVAQVSHWGLSPDAPVSLPVHPVQLYEAAFTFGLLLLVLIRRKRNRPAGIQFLALCTIYGLGYFALGFLRGDLQRSVLVISRFHWAIPVGAHEQHVALAGCVVALGVWTSWKHDQGFWDRFRPIFRAAQTRPE